MTNTLTISRETLEQWANDLALHGVGDIETAVRIDEILAASAVERQEPLLLGHLYRVEEDQIEIEIVGDPHIKDGMEVFTSPPAPVAVPDGWKLVPIEPTELMIRRGDQNYSWSVAKIYSAMIEATPACLDKVKEMNR